LFLNLPYPSSGSASYAAQQGRRYHPLLGEVPGPTVSPPVPPPVLPPAPPPVFPPVVGSGLGEEPFVSGEDAQLGASRRGDSGEDSDAGSGGWETVSGEEDV